MQTEFWPNTGPTSDAGETLPRFLPTPTASDSRGQKHKPTPTYPDLRHVAAMEVAGRSMSFAAASHARTSATPDAEPDSTASEADCFSRPFAWFDNSDPATSCWKTWQRCLLGGWIEYTGSWPRSVIIRNRIAYRLPPLVPRISGTGCSYWPSPVAGDSTSAAKAEDALDRQIDFRGMLCRIIRRPKMWPTPTSHDSTNRGSRPAYPGSNQHTASLDWIAQNEQRTVPQSSADDPLPTLGGQLNPTWVEWLMGFPLGWTDCEDSETPSCPKLPSTSGGE